MNEDNNQNENGFEAYIENEFQEEVPYELLEDLKAEKHSMRMYFMYAFVFTMVLIVFGVTGTYAYYVMQISSESSSTTAITATAECFDVTLSDTDGAVSSDEHSTLSLGDYNYPITDEFAVGNGNEKQANITPMIVKVKNNCTTGTTNVPYKLILSTFKNGDNNTISDDKMKIKITKQEDSGSESALSGKDKIKVNAIGEFTQSEGGNINLKGQLEQAINTKSNSDGLTLNKSYLIDDSTVGPNKTNTYKIYVWVDYYEGCDSNTSTTDTNASCNNSTAGKSFKALVSAIIN